MLKRKNFLDDKCLLNSKFYYILGALEGDGHKKIEGYRLSVKDKDFALFFLNTCKECLSFPVYYHYYKSDNRHKVDIYSVDFMEKIENLMPTTIDEKVWYLKGFYDAEGCFCLTKDNHRNLSVTSGDIPLLFELKNYLAQLGIESKFYYAKKKRSNLKIYSWERQIAFMETIGFRIQRKMNLWEKALAARDIKNLRHHHGIPQNIVDSIIRNYKTTLMTIKETAYVFGIGRTKARQILNQAGISTSKIKKYGHKKSSKYIYSFYAYLYQEKGMGPTQISRDIGGGREAIRIKLKKMCLM